jgi:predicted RecB family nuclease
VATPFSIPPHTGTAPTAISPTDVSQFIRLEQCQRYLRLRLQERLHGNRFLRDADVAPQSIPPILTRSGARFEETVAEQIRAHHPVTVFAADLRAAQGVTSDNAEVVAAASALAPGDVTVLFQPRLEATLGQWHLRGDVDLLRLERTEGGALRLLIADMKSSTSAKVEHRLQVAFYHDMLQDVLSQANLGHAPIELAILYRGSLAAVEEDEQMLANRALAYEVLGTTAGYLEMVSDVQAYLSSVHDLVVGNGSLASRLLATEFDDIPFHLTYKCDGCLYNEFCLKHVASIDDLSLIPHLADGEKSALRTQGITTTAQLATLKEIRRAGEESIDGVQQAAIALVPAPRREVVARKLATTWPVGPRLDELVHRARRYQSWFGDRATEAISWIPHKGYGTLPVSTPDLHPNLVRIYIDVQHDYLQDRVYLLGALVVANEHGQESVQRRRSVVHLADGPPESDEVEADLLREWITAVLQAVVELAAPDAEGEKSAPIHLVFFNNFAQRTLLDACGRHARAILGATALYDFVTQLAAYDSPVATLLETQIREQKNYPMLCQSLQSVATALRFNWNAGVPYREIFRERLFDYLGKLPDEETGELEWYTRRSRFNSQIPLEYAYGAWGNLPAPPEDKQDEFEPYRNITIDLVTGFHARRLEAMEHIARDFRGNRQTTLTPFTLPDLAEFTNIAPTLAHALDEFVMIERHVELAAWKNDRLAPPELRMLRGQALVVQYLEEDQPPEIAERNRENQQRSALYAEQAAAYKAAKPDAKQVRLSKAEKELSNWSQEDLPVRLRIQVPVDLADLDDVLRTLDFKVGDRLVLANRYDVDSRLPVDQQVPFTPTVKQLLRGQRITLDSIETVKRDGQVMEAFAHVHLSDGKSFSSPPFTFSSLRRAPLEAGGVYSLDDDPNNITGYWAQRVTAGLVEGGANRLYDLLLSQPWSPVPHPAAFIDGQERFLRGLTALFETGALHDFEPSKRAFIGDHAIDPVLLVQGPPGTGKSYSTAYALLARLQGAMAAGQPFRILVSCKTHAAIDVLLHNIRDAQEDLVKHRRSHPAIFAEFFDERLIDLPLFRYRPRGTVQQGIVAVPADDELEKGEPKAVDRIQQEAWVVVAATPGGVYRLVKDQWGTKDLFGHGFVHCVVLDEASQMDLPNAVMASLPLIADGQLIVVGDHRQMPPIIKNDWDNEPRRTFNDFKAYQSLFEMLLTLNPAIVQFEESFRLHADMAEFLRREIYVKDGINYRSRQYRVLDQTDSGDTFVRAVLDPAHPLVVIVHDEAGSQLQNQFELDLMRPLLAELTSPTGLNLEPTEGLGVVVPHRAQRAAIADQIADVVVRDAITNEVVLSAVDTVERYQGDERLVMVYSATESDRDYLLRSSKFLMDPRRLNVALSRARRKLIVVASRSVFDLFSADEETFQNAQLWKNLLRHTCTELTWEGQRHGHQVDVWGNPSRAPMLAAATEDDGMVPA